MNRREVASLDGSVADCLTPGTRDDYLYWGMRSVSGILAGGVTISKIPERLDAQQPWMHQRPAKQRSTSVTSLFAKLLGAGDIPSIVIRGFWPIWLGTFPRRSPTSAFNSAAPCDLHSRISRHRVNIAMSKVVGRGQNSIYSVNTKKTDTKASILLRSELAEVA